MITRTRCVFAAATMACMAEAASCGRARCGCRRSVAPGGAIDEQRAAGYDRLADRETLAHLDQPVDRVADRDLARHHRLAVGTGDPHAGVGALIDDGTDRHGRDQPTA